MGLRLRKFLPLLLAALTAVAVFSYVSLAAGSVEEKVYKGRQWVKLPVAKSNIKRFTVIKPGMLKHRRFLAADVNRLSVRKGAAIVGKMTLEAIYSGEQIAVPRLSADTRARLSTQVSPDKVAIEINSEVDSTVSAMAQAGDRVDIMVVSPGVDGNFAQQVFADVLVLDRAGDTLMPSSGSSAIEPTGSLIAEVSPEQAMSIARSTETGEIRIFLHSSRISGGDFHE